MLLSLELPVLILVKSEFLLNFVQSTQDSQAHNCSSSLVYCCSRGAHKGKN